MAFRCLPDSLKLKRNDGHSSLIARVGAISGLQPRQSPFSRLLALSDGGGAKVRKAISVGAGRWVKCPV